MEIDLVSAGVAVIERVLIYQLLRFDGGAPPPAGVLQHLQGQIALTRWYHHVEIMHRTGTVAAVVGDRQRRAL